MIDRRAFLLGGMAAVAACSVGSDRAQAGASRRAATPRAGQLIEAARNQIGVTLAYDPSYSALSYPGGDVPRPRGVCSDVVVRAYRDGLGIDLQEAVHDDMAAHFSAYPRRWGLRRPDSNIDHRRVPNLETFWSRAGARLALPDDPSGWQPGDVFTALVDGRLPHTGVISDALAASGYPLIIHNIGAGAREEDMLLQLLPIGRFRWQV